MAPPKNVAKILCTCSRCRRKLHYENDEEKEGVYLAPQTVKKHIEEDLWRAEQAESELASTIFLAAVSPPPSKQGSLSLPVRRRDSEQLDSRTSSSSNVQARRSESGHVHQGADTAEDVNRALNSGGPGDGSIVHDTDSVSTASATSFTAISQFDASVRTRLKVLGDLDSTLVRMGRTVPKHFKLSFSVRLSTMADPCPEPDEAKFVGFYRWVTEQRRYLSESLAPLGHKDLDRRREAMIAKLDSELARLDSMKERAWSSHAFQTVILARLAPGVDGPVVVPPDAKRRYARTLEPFILAALVMTMVLHSLATASHLPVQYVLAVLQAVLHGAFIFSNTSLGHPARLLPAQASVLKSIPSDVRTALAALDLAPDILRYACCPTCFSTYAPNKSKPDDAYPHTCCFRETDKPVCGDSLVEEVNVAPTRSTGRTRTKYEPRLVFPFRTLQSWFTEILRKPGLKSCMSKAWKRRASAQWLDIFDAEALRNFKGPDGKVPFSVQPDGSLHIVFSMFIDWFNPFGNKRAGKSHSIGAIYLVCMNLPDTIRYRPENIYLAGIIPGPKEPELTQINHLLRPLIDELLVLWTRGYYFASDVAGEAGLLIRAALIPLVCDIPALRKAGGFAGHMSNHFCSFCELPKDDINSLDRASWPQHTWEEHLRYATEWRDAQTEKERDVLFKKHGLRWSELLRLPYWDPTRFAVVDAMHNLFLGELRHHCRDVWGLDIKDKGGDGPKLMPHTPEQQRANLDRVLKGLTKQSKAAFQKIRKGYVVAVAELNGVMPIPANLLTKQAYVAGLLDWAKEHLDRIHLPPVLDVDVLDFHLAQEGNDISKFRVIDRETLQRIREDIASMVLPSWMERPPRNFGSPTHGKLKADQWRTACTVSLVITLCRLWGSSEASERQRLLLDNFIHLVSAVDLATRRRTDPNRIARFDAHMVQYLSTLRSLFNHNFVPNHHLSLHLYECLLLFGPVHAWWAFPFERYNGILQRLNVNNKTRDMPLTFMSYFYIGANVRSLMTTTDWPDTPEYKSMMSTFENAFVTVSKGTPMTNFIPFSAADNDGEELPAYDERKATALPRDLYDALLALLASRGSAFASTHASSGSRNPILSEMVNNLRCVCCGNMTFATSKAARRDSFVLFTDPLRPPTNSFPRAGQIRQIFLHDRLEQGKRVTEPFVAMDEFLPLTGDDLVHDPYRRYPDLATRLFIATPEPRPCVIRLQDIHCHFAALKYHSADLDADCIVA
ncbi:hypothetical protein BN946_scf184881.g3 [Trametes cinnabarina]|uniref:Uncharacterized protein n=1 Tax=Pycnoporus cinnabarinus TaxID=5643 RepID=A0A060SSW0_PYCCI|nr:hypothetical protein BN946_scf184881.g3 [Trametes cinnabarina]